ncbi:MAG TPA: FliM/FliN family flagellar motor switch protein [Candidatus Acidoferrales bacterium]|nr:FliM/FliN family flagellar motor switch protein [Candidatus Acidoferrales bacterium]
MEANWTKAEFKNSGKLQGLSGDLLKLANEALARELSLSLSAFLRSSFTATYSEGSETPFGDLSLSDSSSCFGLALLRQDQSKLLIELETSALYPILGVALGAKPGSFSSPERKPTEIELQVVHLLFRLILSEVCRAWSALVKTPLDTVTIETEQTPGHVWAATEPVLVSRFQLAAEEPLGTLRLIAPLDLLSGLESANEVAGREAAQASAPVENTLELMMEVKVSVDVWLDGSQMLLKDLLQLREGQIVKLDYPVERKVSCTLNGQNGFTGQIASTGTRRAFLVEEASS